MEAGEDLGREVAVGVDVGAPGDVAVRRRLGTDRPLRRRARRRADQEDALEVTSVSRVDVDLARRACSPGRRRAPRASDGRSPEGVVRRRRDEDDQERVIDARRGATE